MPAALHVRWAAHCRLVATFSPTEQETRLTRSGPRLPNPPPSNAVGGVEQLTNPWPAGAACAEPRRKDPLSVKAKAIRTTGTATAGR